MNIVAFIAFILIACFLAVFLKGQSPVYAVLLTIAAAVICIGFIIKNLTPYITEIYDIFKTANINSTYFFTVLKGVAICYISKLASDICKDSGLTSLSNKAELIEKVSLIGLSIPFLKDILDIALGLIK